MKFREDGTFHILHITDIQEIPEVAEDTLTLMRRALDAAKPDLVVKMFTLLSMKNKAGLHYLRE